VDLSQYTTTGTRELYVDATRTDGSGLDAIYVNFSINITTIVTTPEPTSSDVSLSWTAPSAREDDNPISLSEIAGYKIYYGTTQGNYSSSISISDGSATSHTFTNFSEGTYYFVITTRDLDGRESQLSSEVVIIIGEVNSADSNSTDTISSDTTASSTAPADSDSTNSTDTSTETVSSDTTTTTTNTTPTDSSQPINVVADVNLSWTAPAEREDNTAISLSEIIGYKIYYGTTQGNYDNSIDIDDSTAVNHTFNDFPAGTHYFAITTKDTEGRESQFSSEVIIAI
jgi:hypothetical protein